LSQEIVGGLRLLRPTAAASLDKTPTARCAVAKRGHRKTGKY
jgi:hypothetical protein